MAMQWHHLWLRHAVCPAMLLPLVLVTACGQQTSSHALASFPAAFETAVVTGQWEQVESTAAAWMHNPHLWREASIVRGYAALARGDSAAASGHFLHARAGGRNPHPETSWRATLAVRYPQRPMAHLLAGDALARQGDLHGALARLDKALELEPALPLARLARGVLRALSGEHTAALDDLNALTASGPVMAEALVARALVWLEAGQVDHAMADLHRALTLAPEHAVAYHTRGLVQARRGVWEAAAHDFATAFRLLPELVEARQNWQLTQAAQERGVVLSGQGSIGSITIVVADPSKMRDMTATASSMVQARTGQAPVIVTSLQEGMAKASSQHVLLQMPARGLDMAAGDRMLSTLNTIGSSTLGAKIPVNVITHGFEGADSTTMGITRHLHTAASRAHISNLQIVDPSELSGPVGKTPLGVTSLGSLAQRSGQIDAKGIPVAVYTIEGKVGTQHIGNVAAFRTIPGLDVYATPWKASLRTSLSAGIPSALGVSIGVPNAADQASSRTDLGARDWFAFRSGTQQHVTGTLSDLGKHYIGNASQRPLEAPTVSSPTRGGIWLGPVHLARGDGGRIVFESGSKEEGELALVYTIFGRDEHHKQGRRAQSSEESLPEQRSIP